MTVGHIARLCRYPVKSLAGETLEHAFVGFAGVYGDRIYACLLYTSDAADEL